MSGIVGIWSSGPVIRDLLGSAYGLQHGGTKYAGISVWHSGKQEYRHSGEGLLKEVFNSPASLKGITGNAGIGIVGNRICLNSINTHAQPFYAAFAEKSLATCLSGVVTNYFALRKKLESQGTIFHTDSYAELVPHIAARAQKSNLTEGIIEAIRQLAGSFSVVALTRGKMIAARDECGNRSFSLAKLSKGGFAVSSESSALLSLDVKSIRELEPGEIIIVDAEGLSSQVSRSKPLAYCILELINMADPRSSMYGKEVSLFRRMLGSEMGKGEVDGIEADYIIPSPKAWDFAVGFSEVTGLPIIPCIISNEYAIREFFDDPETFLGVRFGINLQIMKKGKLEVLDDILQSSRTAQHFAKILKDSGKAEKIHFRALCSPIDKKLCPFGRSPNFVADADTEFLMKNNLSELLGVDSFRFLNLEALKRAIGQGAENFCFRCLKPA